MSIELNYIHHRVVMAFQAANAHPDQARFMRPELWERVEDLAGRLIPLLAAAGEDATSDEIDKAYAATHAVLKRLHDGCAYIYALHPTALASLAPLTVGADPATDQIRLSHLLGTLPTLTPKFVWLQDCTEAAAKKTLGHHIEARAMDEKVTAEQRTAAKMLRELRPQSHRLWEDDLGLDVWIRANIAGHDAQLAWGRERRKQPRQTPRTPKAPPAGTGETTHENEAAPAAPDTTK